MTGYHYVCAQMLLDGGPGTVERNFGLFADRAEAERCVTSLAARADVVAAEIVPVEPADPWGRES